MKAQEIVPILNVSSLKESFAWFERFGWDHLWNWCPPGQEEPSFGAVCSGDREIFMCLDGQGGRGEHGAWMSIWVEDVDAVHAEVRDDVEVIMAPEDMPWGVREMHVRHPDGHVFRVGTGT